jgi:hypothetical protein
MLLLNATFIEDYNRGEWVNFLENFATAARELSGAAKIASRVANVRSSGKGRVSPAMFVETNRRPWRSCGVSFARSSYALPAA